MLDVAGPFAVLATTGLVAGAGCVAGTGAGAFDAACDAALALGTGD
ncbi:MAG TPA: hypothetical protein VGB82_24930 [Alphaproteobacteria bacterium]